MAQTSENGQQSTLGCKCLNILLTQGKPPGDQRPPKLKESGLTWLYVGEDGIRVVRSSLARKEFLSFDIQKFPGATSRERITRPSSKPGVHFEETQSVKCLFCGTLVYRVRIDQNSEASNSKYVVEDAALMSIDGWVQIFSKNCLVSLMRSSFTPTFTIVLFTENRGNQASYGFYNLLLHPVATPSGI
jgi:hypothetical protein